MERANSTMPEHFIRFQEAEERMVMAATTDSDRVPIMEMYKKTKITDEDLLRQYTQAEVRELCERTKVRVNMFVCNVVWEAKRDYDKEKLLDNRSTKTVNKALLKAVFRGGYRPYTELEVAKVRDVAFCLTKKANNARLDRWHGPYNTDEVEELCVRTRARVKMYALNCVWDAKVRFDRRKRLVNRSQLFVDKLLEKAVNKGMVKPYSDEQVANYREEVRCQTKRKNDERLNRWQRQRARALEATNE